MPRTLFETAQTADCHRRPMRPEPPPLERLKTVVDAAVSVVFAIDVARLQAESRGQAQVAHARQVAMYLMHCAFSLSHTDIGRAFSRDRTTVAHACAIVEAADVSVDGKILLTTSVGAAPTFLSSPKHRAAGHRTRCEL